MASECPPPDGVPPAVPALPAGLLEPWRVIAVGAVCWLVVTVVSFSAPALATWRPVSLAGLATGAIGTTIFLWQRRAALRGARGAQTGLNVGDTERST